MKMKKLALLFGLLLVSFFMSGQDIVTMRSGEEMSVNIVEIAVNTVTYTELDGPDLKITIDKDDIAEIDMENGRVYTFELDHSRIQVLDYDQQMHRAVKMGFLTPTMGSFRLEYEQNIKPGQSMLFTTNLIGLGFDPADENPRGLGISAGYKFMRSPEYYLERQRRSHRMMGAYLMVEANFSGFGRDRNISYYDPDMGTYQNENIRQGMYGGALTLSYGKQYVFGNRFVLDYSVGLGYSFVTSTYESDEIKQIFEENYYGFEEAGSMYNFTHFSNEVPVCLKFRLSIGLLY